MADVAGDVNVGQEMHFDLDDAFALAVFAAAAADVKGEAAGFKAADFGFGEGGEEVADGSPDTGVGGGVRAGGAADGGLVNNNNFIEVFDAVEAFVESGDGLGAV